MVLALTDIITAQQVDKHSKAALYNSAAPVLPSNFRDYLIEPKAAENIAKKELPATTKPYHDIINNTKSAIKAKAEESRDYFREKNIIARDNTGNNNAKAETENAVQSTAREQLHDPQQTQLAEKISSLYNALKNLKDTGEALSEEDIQTLNEILPYLTGKIAGAGITAEQIIAEVANTPDATHYIVDDILDKMSFSTEKKGDKTAAQLAAEVLNAEKQAAALTIDTNAIAVKAIEAAKAEAQKPQVQESELKILPLGDLIRVGKNNEKDSKVKNNLAANSVEIGSLNNADVANQAETSLLQKSLHNAALLQSQIQQSHASSQLTNNIDQVKLDNALAHQEAQGQQTQAQINISNNQVAANIAAKQVVSDAAEKPNLAGKLDNANALTGNNLSSENFIKFQNLFEQAQSTNKTNYAGNMPKAEEILAQIKFGMQSGLNGKDEKNISIQLHPKELGKVDISMHMNHNGKTHVVIVAENTDTLNLLQKEASMLRDMLTDALKTNPGDLNFSFQEKGGDEWKQFVASKSGYKGNMANNAISGAAGIAQNGYGYNMIASEGLDIRV